MLPVDLNIKSNRAQNSNLIGRVKLKILVVSSLVIGSLICAQLVFASSLATDGQKLSEVYDQIEQIESENTTIKVEIAKNSSLSNLSKTAKDSGFAKPSEVITF